MTWEELQKVTLYKMDASEDGIVSLTNDENIGYVKAMPQAANEGAMYICGFKPWRKKVEYEIEPSNKAQTVEINEICYDMLNTVDFTIYLMDSDGNLEEAEFHVIAGEYIQIPANTEGTLIVYYTANPMVFDNMGNSDTVPLDKDVVTLLPLYIASEIYKPDDDDGMTTVWRAELDAAVAKLTAKNSTVSGWVNTTGWL